MSRLTRRQHWLLLLGLVLLVGATGMRQPAPHAKDEKEKQIVLTIHAPATLTEGSVTSLQIAVANDYGAPAGDLPVALYVDGAFSYEVESDSQGIVIFSLPAGLAAGEHVLVLQAKGKHGFRDGWLQSTLTVLNAAPIERLPATISQVDVAVATALSTPTPFAVVDNVPLAATLTALAPPLAEISPPLVVATAATMQASIASEPVAATVAPVVAVATPTAIVALFIPTIRRALPTQVIGAESASLPSARVESITGPSVAGPAWVFPLPVLGIGFGAGLLVMFLLLLARRGWRYIVIAQQLLTYIWRKPALARPTKRPTGQPMSNFQYLLLNHVRTAKWGLLCALASMVGSALMDLISPWPLKIIFDYILLDSPLPAALNFLERLTDGDLQRLLFVVVATIAVIALLQSSFAYLENYMTTRAGYQLVNTLRTELFLHFQQLSLTFHQEAKRGELVFNVADDAQTLRDAFTDSALSLITQVLTVVGMFLVMFYVNWRLSLIPLFTFPLLFVVYLYLQERLKAAVRKLRKKEGQIAAQLTENLSIMPVIQAFGREQQEATRFDTANSQNLESGIQIARLGAALNRTISLISELGLAAVIFVGAWLALRGAMTPGDVLIFVSYVQMLYKPLRQMVKMSTKLNSAWVAGQRIAAVLDIEPAIQDKPNAIPAHNLRGDLAFEQVAFHYKPGQPVLRDVSFWVRRGQRVALVGPSGAGKSTITSLLLRLYDPSQGAIRIDGVDLRDYQRSSLRQQIGLVLQDALLFGATIRENICYGKPDATQAEIETAARQAHIHDFIITLPKGYETQLGEMGSNLSGGQRQRIAIARALVKDPAILLLDEPTSALDAESKALVDATINQLQRGKTVVVIAHHLASIQHFDQIIVMDQGRVAEQGTHAQLLARRGVYAELYRLQNQTPTIPLTPISSHFMPSLVGAD